MEGVKPIRLAISNGWDIKSFVYARGSELSDWALELLGSGSARQAIELPPALMQALSEKEHTSEILATISIRDDSIWSVPKHPPFAAVVLDRPGSPGNLGTIIRTSCAFGLNGVVLFGHAVDLYDPHTIRASVGTIFSIPVGVADSRAEVLSWLANLREQYPNLLVVGTSAKAVDSIEECDFKLPSVIIMGNETRGMSGFLRNTCDLLAKIEIKGSAGSLNVATAAAIALHELSRKRRLAT